MIQSGCVAAFVNRRRKSRWRPGHLIAERRFSLRRGGQGFLAGCDRLPARVLYLLCLNCIELGIFREFRRQIRIRIDGVHWTYLYTCHAINAFIGVNDHLSLEFIEAGDRAHFYAVGKLTSVTFLGDDVGHGIEWIKVT